MKFYKRFNPDHKKHEKQKVRMAFIEKIFIINEDGHRERIHINGVPSKKPTNIEKVRWDIKKYTNAVAVIFEFTEI